MVALIHINTYMVWQGLLLHIVGITGFCQFYTIFDKMLGEWYSNYSGSHFPYDRHEAPLRIFGEIFQFFSMAHRLHFLPIFLLMHLPFSHQSIQALCVWTQSDIHQLWASKYFSHLVLFWFCLLQNNFHVRRYTLVFSFGASGLNFMLRIFLELGVCDCLLFFF